MKPKKVGYFGLFGQQNWGNECTLQAFICNARKHLPDWEMYCVCTDPEDTSKRFGIPAFPMKAIYRNIGREQSTRLMRLVRRIFFRIPVEILHLVRAFRIVKGTHMLVVPGTGLLTDFERRVLGRCYEVFKWSAVAKLCRSKLLFVSIGAGPIRHPLNRWFIKSALSLADYRSYRNGTGKQYLELIGFKTGDDEIYPDLAFSLPRNILPERVTRDPERPVIGVGVADRVLGIKVYYNEDDSVEQQIEAIYWNAIDVTSSFVDWLLDNKYTVRLLLGDSLYDMKAKEDLKDRLIKRGYDFADKNILDDPVTSVEQLISQLATTEAVVSPRYHNIILALMLNKPVIGLSYHDKFGSLMAEFKLEEYCQQADDLHIDNLKELFSKLMANADKIKEAIKITTEQKYLALEKQYSLIFNRWPNV